MYKNHSGNKDDELWNRVLRHRAKMLLARQDRSNIKDFIHLLSFYVSPRPSAKSTAINGVYENICNKQGFKPCGYAVHIAIEKLPINSCKK